VTGRRLAIAAAVLALLPSACRKEEPSYVPSDFLSWRRTTEVPLDYPIPGHMDTLRVPRMNAVGWTAAPVPGGDGKNRWDFPEGTVIVKEVYSSRNPAPGEGPSMLTVMAKQPRDSRALGGWLWITKSSGGEEKVFTGSFCVSCHANANERHPYFDRNPLEEFRDYVFFVPEGR
jgi:hypothetical protein